MVLDEPPFKAGRRKALKTCPFCRVKMFLEAKHTMYAHMAHHIEQAWRQNEQTHKCQECRVPFSDKDQLIDHMLSTHSPVLMVPTSSKTFEKAFHLTTTITRREIERAAWN